MTFDDSDHRFVQAAPQGCLDDGAFNQRTLNLSWLLTGYFSVWKSGHETGKKPTTGPDLNRSRPEISKTDEDRDRGPVYGPSQFKICEDRRKTGLNWS